MNQESNFEGQISRDYPNGTIHYLSVPINKNKTTTPFSPGIITTNDTNPTKRRKSILDQPIGSFKGVNSLSKFATSLQRANSFKAIEIKTDKERSYFKDGTDELYDPITLSPSIDGRRLSIAFTGAGSVTVRPSMSDLYGSMGTWRESCIVEDYEEQPSPIALRSVLSNSSIHFVDLTNTTDADSIMLKQIETKNGEVITILAGQSTGPQTIFNSVNVLIGVGLLALPLGLRYAGWLFGISMLVIFAIGTFCSAELLSRCLDTDPTLISYGDLGYAAFGSSGRGLISVLFALDLMGCGVSLIILFGDSLNALFPQYSSNFFKIVGFFAVTPQIFMPLNVLSNFSLLGILSTIGTVLTILFCGLHKDTSPGSLLHPEPTHLWPSSFKELCLSIGLLSACWGGHAVFPNLKSDMRHPEKFKSCLKTTYSITAVTDIGIAVIGFLMFGNMVKDEITKSVILTPEYPDFVYILISVLMSIIPLAKIPLNARPIVAILDTLMGIVNNSESVENEKKLSTNILECMNKLIVNALFVLIAIQFPEFDKLIAFCGAGLCFMICSILPCLFYLKICKSTIKPYEAVACWVAIICSMIFAVLGVGAAIF